MAFTAYFSATPLINFVNNSIRLDGRATSADAGTITQYVWYPIPSVPNRIFTTAASASISYSQVGSYSPAMKATRITYGIYDYATYLTSSTILINPVPKIAFLGAPMTGEVLTFFDNNASSYLSGTIANVIWNFGDGLTSSSNYTSATFNHSFSGVGLYNVRVSAVDVSGNVGVGSQSISIIDSTPECAIKNDYIALCGPERIRWGKNKLINLVDFLPQYMRDTSTEDFLKVFEDFLNTMFTGDDGFTVSSSEVSVSASAVSGDGINTISGTYDSYNYYFSGATGLVATEATNVENLTINWPENSDSCNDNRKISILEKIKRLTELQDPELIDLDYIQFFAKNLGYNIDIYRDEIIGSQFGNLAIFEDVECSAVNQEKYLRFVVENLPNWYKIKTTRNAIKVMLYSFGLIGDIVEYYTNTYSSADEGDWVLNEDGTLDKVDNSWYPTPHFAIIINIDRSSNVSFDIARRNSIIKAIESVRPINSVFRRLAGKMNREMDLYVGGLMRINRYMNIRSSDEYPSDYFYS